MWRPEESALEVLYHLVHLSRANRAEDGSSSPQQDEHSIVLSFALFPLTPSSPALTGCDHPCLHLLSALAFFFLCFHCCTGLSPVWERGRGHFSCGTWASHCGGFSYCRHGLSCSKACGILLDQGSNSFLPHWQADSLPLSHQGRPLPGFVCPSQLSPYILQGLIHVPFSMKSCLMTPANTNLILSWLSSHLLSNQG